MGGEDFDRYAEQRGRSRVLRDGSRRRTEAVLARLAVAFPEGRFRLLDVGTADGSMLERIREATPGSALVGLEPVTHLAEAARARGFEVHEQRIEDLPFEDGTFDAVTVISTLKHVPDADAALGQCRRVLREGGHLVLSDPTPLGIRLGLWRGHFERRYLPHVWSLARTKREVEAAGFEVLHASRYMPFPLLLPGSGAVERVGRVLGLSRLFMQQLVHAVRR